MNSRDTTPPRQPDEIEIREDGSTIDRFMDLTRRLLGVSREDVRAAEKTFTAERRKRKAGSGLVMPESYSVIESLIDNTRGFQMSGDFHD